MTKKIKKNLAVAKSLNQIEYFINRELSWLEFNHRVLEEAQDKRNPLFERLKLTAIASSNLDEFFMVRVASIWDQIKAGFDQPDASGATPREVMGKVSQRIHQMIDEQYHCFRYSLKTQLRRNNLRLLRLKDLRPKQKKFIARHYFKAIYPVVTPLVVDRSRSFPLVQNRSLNIALFLENEEKKGQPLFATVQVPSVLDRVLELPGDKKERCFILLEDVIKTNLKSLFRGFRILSIGCYRVTRNADLGFDEEGAEDLLETIQQSLKMRRWGSVVRLEVERDMDASLRGFLEEAFEVPEGGTYEISGPLDLTLLFRFASLPGYDSLCFDTITPRRGTVFKDGGEMFKAIAGKDMLLHHPYDSFDQVVDFIRLAAEDPQVLAIKQTLYRVSGSSPIVEALAQAVGRGKQVTVLLEIRARFDEENNIVWAKRLEQAGCHVIYGLAGLKTHCKVTLVVRQEEDELRRYVHLGTGNYNDVTARLYTDLGLFTADPDIGDDASSLFNFLSGQSSMLPMRKLVTAPAGMRERFLSMIRGEAANARRGVKGRIIAKVNSLVDEEIIQALYCASSAGVEIDLIVRGICCLRPGLPGVSDNIRVRSIVGRFLEHSRIFYFYSAGNEKLFLSSADLMSRNLDHRVELLFPIEDRDIHSRIKNLLEINLKDTEKARAMNPDGSYRRVRDRSKEPLNAQEFFITSS
ncbi:MAG: RNA degradosome polyphosphate kinase [Firmicutes bacterium]|nr:RNA degradosome polyphosphate kinase [Bacillota bacterium]